MFGYAGWETIHEEKSRVLLMRAPSTGQLFTLESKKLLKKMYTEHKFNK